MWSVGTNRTGGWGTPGGSGCFGQDEYPLAIADIERDLSVIRRVDWSLDRLRQVQERKDQELEAQ